MHFANVLKRFESNYQKSYEIHALLKFVYDTQNEFRVDSLFTLKNVCMEKQKRVSQKSYELLTLKQKGETHQFCTNFSFSGGWWFQNG